MIVEVNGNIDVFKDEPHKFIIFNGSYLANSGVLVDLDNNTYYKIPISETERQYFRAVCRLRQYNANNNLSKLKIEAIGSTATYEVYTFSEGWTYKIRSRLIQSFSGELRLVKQNHNNNTNIIVQNFKNLPYSSNETKKTLEEEWSDNLGFSPDYKYMYYLNNEPDGRRFAYFIEL
jgi:hypothetical protein